jgi:hypothetical protein
MFTLFLGKIVLLHLGNRVQHLHSLMRREYPAPIIGGGMPQILLK